MGAYYAYVEESDKVNVRKKIGIVTICNKGNNFGGKLQNYALQTVLEKLGYDAETVFDSRSGGGNPWSVMTYIKDIVHYITRIKYQPSVHKAAVSFLRWKRRYLKACPVVLRSSEDYPRIAERLDGVVVGSDQVWAPAWLLPDYAFAQFVEPQKRIAYAPSIGVSEIAEELKEAYKNGFNGFERLSVREDDGAKIIKEMIGRKADVLVDPAMLLSVDDWNKIAVSNKKKEYVFVYVLGEMIPAYRAYIQELESSGLEIVDILRDKRYAGGHPGNFVGYIRDAEMVVTDSFHGTVFSLLYHKPITLLNRTDGNHNMNSRFETLFDKFDVCHVPIGENINHLVFDWEKVEEKLEFERRKSMEYLTEELQKK